MPLRGLTLDDTAALLREPLQLSIPDAVVETLWEQTGGHPLLLQKLMERAVDAGGNGDAHVFGAMHSLGTDLASVIFPIWWANLTDRGQSTYRTLARAKRPMARGEWARELGNDPAAVVEILETTGVARAEGGELVPRGALFRAWVEQNHPFVPSASPQPPSPCTLPKESLEGRAFERLVIEGTARWTRDTIELPIWHVRSSRDRENQKLLPEQHFQLSLVTALRQRDLLAEPEPLSSGRGRTDLKIRWYPDPNHRACIEVKLWGGTGYKDVVRQVLGYAVEGDEFAGIVMVDRGARPLAPRYREECLAEEDIITEWPPSGQLPPTASYPAFVTLHPLPWGALRVYHFLVQLPPDER